jgi:hypothetical protein
MQKSGWWLVAGKVVHFISNTLYAKAKLLKTYKQYPKVVSFKNT